MAAPEAGDKWEWGTGGGDQSDAGEPGSMSTYEGPQRQYLGCDERPSVAGVTKVEYSSITALAINHSIQAGLKFA
jgi:hypothetical protein